MSRLIECIIVEPPTGAEVLAEAIANLANGEFELVLQPTSEVPRLSPIAVTVALRNINTAGNENLNATASGSVLIPTEEYASVVVRIPNGDTQAASATLVTYE
jgi:hypothetical protein